MWEAKVIKVEDVVFEDRAHFDGVGPTQHTDIVKKDT